MGLECYNMPCVQLLYVNTVAINKIWMMVLLESISYLTKEIIKGDVSVSLCVVCVVSHVGLLY